ncbi:MAG: hypothetical protein FWF75_04535 [Propionibacteriaceae bacterium]|nr:hypothetical protein [Propionibacteriaceae bacterium]
MTTPRLCPANAVRPSSYHQPGGIAGYDTQAEAERTIRYLTSQGVPADQLMLVGTGLRMVVPQTQVSPWRRIVMIGVGAGLVCGLGLSVVLWWFLPAIPVYEVIGWCLGSGIVYGAVASLVVYALTHSESERTPELVPVPSRFDVVGDAAVAARARTLLAEAEEADEGWEVIEAPTSEVTVDPRMWSRSAGVATPEPEAEPTVKPEAVRPAEPVRPSIPLRPPVRIPEPLRLPERPHSPEHAQPGLTQPAAPAWHPARALPGDDAPAESQSETTTARRYSFDL